ncbi:MAG: 2-oxoacid:ferredoxin oxidoreductase subunit beta [Pseudomonadales bacterium]|jgi:2-oxoglutarate ferredoxin oxidoreductase subunit beta|nr:2-oxoacid:ferredoxin oxidoreductase subunit beta [Pseudomonadales bacterium]MDP7595195.1 2-oxoacid:ferredoxin oxidoreductase subunit beta [Pseudomonadales bacterium]HJN50162.1 2-oxoacid:ferredoxin oxidoreductase subunit beta [Pseudomonadales bacterium]|tara:strand:- start:387 stop:1409 length:1023 start_codon:yes stop_codon:yes gene_type:complete
MSVVTDRKLSVKDYASDQEVRWCPGCGDYAILKTIQKLLPELGVKKENQVFISGIGCSSRLPYYMDTFGFHTIHGRAPAVATGVRLANPDLDVWVITGDGDGLSIGGNHMIHALRRNVNMQIILFNNEIYGLTKGQASPTSKVGTISPSTPDGSVDMPISPCGLALGAGARFVGRSIDTEMKQLSAVISRGYLHDGSSFIEIYQNCPVYNDGNFDYLKDKKLAADAQVVVEHGKPLLFGKARDKGLRLNRDNFRLEVLNLGDDGVSEEDILIHDETNKGLGLLLCEMTAPDFPVAVGVIYCNPGSAYVQDVYKQRIDIRSNKSKGDINKLLQSGNTWTVK